jgi:purine-cytosine permease-like protein
VALLNLATVTGFVIIDCVIGGTTLAAVSPGAISVDVGIVILAVIALFISFCGYRVLHEYERYAWIFATVAIIVATGYGGKNLSQQVDTEPATASTVLSFAGLIAGYLIPWGGLSSDFSIYIRPDAPA